MPKKIFLTNARYDLPSDAFSCDVKAEIDGITFDSGIFSITPDDDRDRFEMNMPQTETMRLLEAFALTNTIQLLALVASALDTAFTADDETYADMFDRGDLIVAQED